MEGGLHWWQSNPTLPSIFMYYWKLYHLNADIDCTLEKAINMNGVFFSFSGALGWSSPNSRIVTSFVTAH